MRLLVQIPDTLHIIKLDMSTCHQVSTRHPTNTWYSLREGAPTALGTIGN